MTSFRFHTNFTNPLKITNLATSPTKSNYPKLLFIPQHRRAGFSCRRLSSTVTDVVVLEVKLLQTSIGLKAFSQGLANSCRGETGGIHPLSPPGEEQSTHRRISTEYSAQNTESVGGDHLSRPLFLCSHSISCWGSSRIRIFKICQSRASRTGKKNCKNISLNPQRVAAEMPLHPGPRSCCS